MGLPSGKWVLFESLMSIPIGLLYTYTGLLWLSYLMFWSGGYLLCWALMLLERERKVREIEQLNEESSNV